MCTHCTVCTANKSRAMHLNGIWISHTQTQIVHFFRLCSFLYSTILLRFGLLALRYVIVCIQRWNFALSLSHSFFLCKRRCSFKKIKKINGKKGNTTNVNNCCRWNWRESTHAEWNVCMFTGNWILNGAHYYEACENWKILFISSSDFKL